MVEAVAGIEFRPRGFDVVRLVRETARWAEGYPIVTQRGPLTPSRPSGMAANDGGIQLVEGVLPMPVRLWSTAADDEWLVQSQDDRLILNWRRFDDNARYPKYDAAIRPEFERLLGLLERGESSVLPPIVTEFTYVNHISSDVARLHEAYAVFRKPDTELPDEVVVEAYQRVTRAEVDHGVCEVALSIQPAPPGTGMTILNISAKVFVSVPVLDADVMGLLDTAHRSAKAAFFAIVSERMTQRWGLQEVSDVG